VEVASGFALWTSGYAFGYDPTGRFQLRLKTSSYDPTGRSVFFRSIEYLKSAIRNPQSEI